MKTIFAHLAATITDPPQQATYTQDFLTAVAAAAALVAILVVVYLVIRGIYLVVRIFTQAALYVTAAIVGLVIVIGLLNR